MRNAMRNAIRDARKVVDERGGERIRNLKKNEGKEKQKNITTTSMW